MGHSAIAADEDTDAVLAAPQNKVLDRIATVLRGYAGICPCIQGCLPSEAPRGLTRTRSTVAEESRRRRLRLAVDTVLNSCGHLRSACESCGCAGGDGRRRKENALKQVIRRMQGKAALDFVNDYVEKEWPHISEWFEMKMKKALQPILKKNIHDSIEITVSNLGTLPASLLDLQSTKIEQDDHHIVLVGTLDFQGDAEIEVKVRPGGVDVAKVKIVDVSIQGTLAIEFVRLIPVPPWFSGLRIYFPDAPEVSIRVQQEVFLLDRFFDSASLIQSRILKSLKNVIGNFAVLPNAFVVDFNKGLEPFDLRHKAPEGVLRLQLVKPEPGEEDEKPFTAAQTFRAAVARRFTANNARAIDKADDAMGDDKSSKDMDPVQVAGWRRWLGGLRGAAVSMTEDGDQQFQVDVALGHRSVQLKVGDSVDLLVQDRQRQNVRVALRPVADAEGGEPLDNMEESVEAFAVGQDGIWPAKHRFEHAMLLAKEGPLNLTAEWRPFLSSDPAALNKFGSQFIQWCAGDYDKATWLLQVDLYHALGLPASVEAGTHVWSSVTIRKRGAKSEDPPIEKQESYSVDAIAPVDRALELFRGMGEFRGGFPAEAEAALRSGPSAQVWRAAQLGYDPAVVGMGPMDALLMHPFRFLLDSGESLLDTIKNLEVVVALKVPQSGKIRDPNGKRERVLGQASWNLATLVSQDTFTEDVSLKVRVGSGTSSTIAHVKLRLQARPLDATPNLKNAADANQTQRVRKMYNDIAERFRSSIARRNSGEFEDVDDAGMEATSSRVVRWLRRSVAVPPDATIAELPQGTSTGSTNVATGAVPAVPSTEGNFIARWWRGLRTRPQQDAPEQFLSESEADEKRISSANLPGEFESPGEADDAGPKALKSALSSPGSTAANRGPARRVVVRDVASMSSVGTNNSERRGSEGSAASAQDVTLSDAVINDLRQAERRLSTPSVVQPSPSSPSSPGAAPGDVSPQAFGQSMGEAHMTTIMPSLYASPAVLAVRAAARRM